MKEPSVLDYVKARLMPWRGPAPQLPALEAEEAEVTEAAGAETAVGDAPVAGAAGAGSAGAGSPAAASPAADAAGDENGVGQESWEAAGRPMLAPAPAAPTAAERTTPLARSLPWRSLLALALAFFAQRSLEPAPDRSWLPGAILYLFAFSWLAAAIQAGEWKDVKDERRKTKDDERTPAADFSDPSSISHRPSSFILSLFFSLAAFLTFGGNRFTLLNLSLLALSFFFFVRAFWVRAERRVGVWARLRRFAARPGWRLDISSGSLLLLAATALVLFFRFYRIGQVPPEMVSDHAEKLLDVWDVLNGETRIFFPRNTGREAIQMYLTAAIVKYLGTGYSFLSLKLGTVLAGVMTLPFIYLLGKEIGNRRVGLLALVFAGIAYWPNVISRVGLRFPFYPLFVAPALYFLVRGLRTSNRNDFILAGAALGIGLHGYTPIRILPFVILAAVGLYLLHRQPPGRRGQAVLGLVLLASTALILFLPLLRYSLEDPALFGYRAFTRLSSLERPLPGPAWQIFLKNLWNAMIMFSWSDGNIWLHSVTSRPALDVVSGALFHLGMALLVMRYIRRRHWLDLFLLLSVPMLMLPSILSLAFPDENPALNRAGGAIVPVFLIVALSLDRLLAAFPSGLGAWWGRTFPALLALFLIGASAAQNYDLVFNQYRQAYAAASWNTTELGQVIRSFANSIGSPDTVWVVPYPHWVDTRLAGINAGYPTRDYAIWPEQFASTQADGRAKLFLLRPEDAASLQALQDLYPQGTVRPYESDLDHHDFLMFFVPPER